MFVYLGYMAFVFLIYKLYLLLPRHSEPLYRKYASKDSWCLITGCTDGIGQAMALYLASKGWNLILVGRNMDKLENLKKSIKSVQIELVQVDFGDDLTMSGDSISSSHKRIESAISKVPQLNMLINNAGVSHDYPMEFSEESLVKMKQIINVNIMGVVVTTKLAINKLKLSKGCIINLGSFSGLCPSPLLSVYSGSKVFLQYLSDCIAIEEKIDVYHLDTYFVSTKMSKMRATLFCPTADAFAKSVLDGKLSCKTLNGYTGYYTHSLLKWGIVNLMTTSFWVNYVYKLHLSIKKRAMRKLNK